MLLPAVLTLDNRKKAEKRFKDLSGSLDQYVVNLPAELRNRIYALVLHDNKSAGKPIRVGRLGRWTKKYRQPSILAVSSQLRKESLEVFTGNNIFDVRIDLHEGIEKALAWVQGILTARRHVPGTAIPFAELRLRLVAPVWAKLAELVPLAKFIRQNQLDFDVITTKDEWEGRWPIDVHCKLGALRAQGRRLFIILPAHYRFACKGVSDFLALAQKARVEGWSEEQLEEALDVKMKELVAKGPGKKASKLWLRQQAEREAAAQDAAL